MPKLLCVIFFALLIKARSRLVNDRMDSHSLRPNEHSRAVPAIIGSNSCSKCPAGWGVKRACTRHAPTECERCVNGETYSSQYLGIRRCWPCSKCGIGLYEARKCTRRKDTVCDDCLKVIYKPDIKQHKDFHEKCGYLFLGKNRSNAGKTVNRKDSKLD